MIDPYKNIWLKLNEVALLQRWSDKFNANFYNLFETNEKFDHYTVDIRKFTKLYDEVEGLENTPKIIHILKLLGDVILVGVPEIVQQTEEIIIQINKTNGKANLLCFHKSYSKKYHIV